MIMLKMLFVFQVSLCERSRIQLETLVDKLKSALTGDLLLLLLFFLFNINVSDWAMFVLSWLFFLLLTIQSVTWSPHLAVILPCSSCTSSEINLQIRHMQSGVKLEVTYKTNSATVGITPKITSGWTFKNSRQKIHETKDKLSNISGDW